MWGYRKKKEGQNMLINENTGMCVCLQKQEGKWSRGPVGLGMNSSVSYSKGKCTEHACALTVLLLIYCTWTEVETILREDATNRSLIVKGRANGADCFHAEKTFLSLMPPQGLDPHCQGAPRAKTRELWRCKHVLTEKAQHSVCPSSGFHVSYLH